MSIVNAFSSFRGRAAGLGLWGLALLGLVGLTPSAAMGGQSVRPAVWAGRFYPAEPDELAQTITALLGKAARDRQSLPSEKALRALVLPHAGYAYSGLTAAHGALALSGESFAKVILLGPDHRIGFTGCAVSSVAHYETPLGRIRLHADAAALRKRGDLFRASPASDRQEHSLEVILPFLQRCLPQFELVPIVMGPSDAARVARHIDALLDPATLLVVSSDLSHFLSYEEARRKDADTIRMILELQAGGLQGADNRACGAAPLETLIRLARLNRWQPLLLHYSNSGDTAGDRRAVVGYAAIAFYGDATMERKPNSGAALSPEQGQALVQLARMTIQKKLGLSARTHETAALESALGDAAFDAPRGTFVTLKINDNLRGCIGSLVAERPLADDVRENAVNAAFHDPRFAALTPDELDRVTIEVSILSPPEILPFEDADDLLAKLRVDVDGVILKKGARRATFLPQVWQQLPRPEDFLGHLCMKAGLPADQWRRGDIEISTYQVNYFEEER